ncbi:MAG: hypothetical protein KUG77_03190 [Nannocystaceae bacterium]|nr:hypothetical protein [Nannocystaceae bacterium]
MTSCVRPLALAPLCLAMLGACLPALGPNIRPARHHMGLTAHTKNDTCMGCHEAEQRVLERLTSMPAAKREAAILLRMQGGGGASLVAQWMLDDPRPCAGCHQPRAGSW